MERIKDDEYDELTRKDRILPRGGLPEQACYKQVTAYQSRDGKLFTTRKAAMIHTAVADAKESIFVLVNKVPYCDGKKVVNDFLTENWDALQAIFVEYDRAVGSAG